ncbi:helix-turn-helix domain-containing protein [Actinomadura sp. NPDC047616]|uniref:TetR/AcrR family transcriptional regulator n=1 Tax=Actinomadura sp. NPDC047616 TaxID=3155914 RepID=UPI0033CE2357
MPRISEPTVAQHRARQLRTLLDAGRALVAEEGPERLSLAALARRVGLSRPSLYEYFRSRDDLVAAIVEDELPRWAAAVEQALAGPADLVAKVEAYVRAQLEMMTDGRHAAAVALAEHALAEPARERIRDGHAQLLRPLVTALADGGVPDPQLRAALVQGIVDAAARAAQRQAADPETIVRTAVAQAVHGLATVDTAGAGNAPVT